MSELYKELVARRAELYFVGIGGVSMSSLALIAARDGCTVRGSDCGGGANIELLRGAGITVYPRHDAAQLGNADALIYTAAIRPGNPELDAAAERGIPVYSRAAFLGSLMGGYRRRVGIAGTHGKTTTTSMAAMIAITAGLDPTVISGAPIPAMGGAFRIGGTEHFIFEADEYKDSFLSFSPTTAVILNADRDHVDYFENMEQYLASFRRYASYAETIVASAGCPNVRRAVAGLGGEREIVWFRPVGDMTPLPSDMPGTVYSAAEVGFDGPFGRFTLMRGDEPLCRVSLAVPGAHNISDAVAAAAAMHIGGASTAAIADALGDFSGAHRRFELRGRMACGAEVYDDYAHHPSEVAATLAAAEKCGKRVWCAFQPHTYSRTAGLFDEFVSVFSDFASRGGKVIFADIDSAGREENTFGVTSADLAAAVDGALSFPAADGFAAAAAYLADNVRSGDMVFTMGAGGITRLGGLIVKA